MAIYQYDVFINFSPVDKHWVDSTLEPRLRRAGLHLNIGQENFEVGIPIADNIEKSVHSSYKTILVMTPAWVQDAWSQHTANIIINSDPTARLKKRLLPIKLKECTPPPALRMLHFADCIDPADWDLVITRLIRQIREAIEAPGVPSSIDPHDTPTLLAQESEPTQISLQQAPIIEASTNNSISQLSLAGKTIRVGDTIGHFEVLSVLGSGGFAITYLAYDRFVKRNCVIKQLKIDIDRNDEQKRQIRRMLKREVEIIGRLASGPIHIPDVYEFLEEYDSFVMRYIDGRNLKILLQEQNFKPLHLRDALHYVRSVCDILCYMHTQPEWALHGDIKLENIILDTRGDIWLIDFGLGKLLARESTPNQYALEAGAGTPGYTPREQWEGASQPRSDIHALAVVLYQLLTGGQYPPGLDENLLSAHRYNNAVTPEIDRLIAEGMDADVQKRPDAPEFRSRLDILIDAILCAPDKTIIDNPKALIHWCETHWAPKDNKPLASNWLYTTMASQIEKAWKDEEGVRLVKQLREITAQFPDKPEHNQGLDAALAVIEPGKFGVAVPQLAYSIETATTVTDTHKNTTLILDPLFPNTTAKYSIDFGKLRAGSNTEYTLIFSNPGHRYVSAYISDYPSWITIPINTTQIELPPWPNAITKIMLTAHSYRLARHKLADDYIEIRSGSISRRIHIKVTLDRVSNAKRWKIWPLLLGLLALVAMGLYWFA